MSRNELALPRAALADRDWIRGLAAVAVLVGHVRGLFWVDYDAVAKPHALLRAVYFATGLGHQAVIVFFVLSGFFVGYSVLSAHSAGRWNWRQYAVRRATRLYVVLLPCLFLTALLDGVGLRLFGPSSPTYLGNIGATHLNLPNVAERLSVSEFFVNLAMLQHITGSQFGSNGPLWSLPYEFWAYALFPAAVAVGRRPTATAWRIALVACVLAIALSGGPLLVFYFSLWLMGAGVAHLWLRYGSRAKPATVPRWWLAPASLAFVAALATARMRVTGLRALEDAMLAGATSVVIAVLLFSAGPATSRSSRYTRGATWLASISYSLYLTHYPFIVFAHAATGSAGREQPTLLAAAKALGLCGLALFVVALPVAWLTEYRTDRVRRFVVARLGLATAGKEDAPQRAT